MHSSEAELNLTGERFRSPLKVILQSGRYRAILSATGLAYWLLYGFSFGMLQYYSRDLTELLKTSPVPNPFLYTDFRTLTGLYNSGIIWFPNGHFEMVFLLGPSIFSVLLSILFGLNITLLSQSWRIGGLKMKRGVTGFLGIIPALFSGGCCTIPLGTVLLASILPSTTLNTFAFNYAFSTNFLVGLLMLASIIYTKSKITNCQCITNSSQA